jgi:predicted enzyme related to lactoylglutathione lyase
MSKGRATRVTDPLEGLRLPVVPIAPREEFVAGLRRRLEAALSGIQRKEDSMTTSEVGYITIGVPDAERARTFYDSLLRWEFQPTIPGQFQISNLQPLGGVWGGAERPEITLLFHVEDVEAAVARVRELGGEAEEPQDRPYGRIASCRDDQGMRFDLLERPTAR